MEFGILLLSSLTAGLVLSVTNLVCSSLGVFLGTVTPSAFELFDEEDKDDEDDRCLFIGFVQLFFCSGLGCFFFGGRSIGVGGNLGGFDRCFFTWLDLITE